MKSFSKLEKDKKTFEHLTRYYIALMENLPLMVIDMEIQAHELEDHMNRCGLPTSCMPEMNSWIQKNSENLRTYLNALKMLALFIYIDNTKDYRDKVVWDLFCTFVDVWNQESEIIMDTIRLK